jgi:hypothetical protein
MYFTVLSSILTPTIVMIWLFLWMWDFYFGIWDNPLLDFSVLKCHTIDKV